jgi:PRTRC genetic system ThiF family protein
VGGTGASLAHITARILWDRLQSGQSVPTLHLVDGDMVEEKNIGRQHFLPLDIGQNKAAVTARRLSLLYGLPIVWSDEMFNAEKHLPRGSVVVGCVDNHQARRAIVAATEGVTVLECGNARTHGQVVLSNTGSLEKVMGAIERMEREQPDNVTRNNIYQPCHHLPNIALLYPELLEPEPPQPASDASCAELIAKGDQHLLVNDFMAMIAGQYLYKLLYREPITTFMTIVDLHNLSLESKRLYPEELRAALAV